MSDEKELKRFITGGQDVDFNKVLLELTNMAYSSARRIGRRVDKNDVDEISSCLFSFLWESRERFPMSEEEVFSKLKRIIYKTCSLTNEIGGFDSSFENMSNENQEDLEVETEEKQLFLKGIDSLMLPENLVEEYKKIVYETDIKDLYELAGTDSFLSHLLLAFLMRKMEISDEGARKVFNLTKREEEVLLTCFSLKVVKTWMIPSYILFGQNLFISITSFLGSAFVSPFEKYFKNLFLSVQIYCNAEKYLREIDLEDTLKLLSKKYLIRVRDIKGRYFKIQKMIKKFKVVSSLYVIQIKADLESFYRKGSDQLCFHFVKESHELGK